MLYERIGIQACFLVPFFLSFVLVMSMSLVTLCPTFHSPSPSPPPSASSGPSPPRCTTVLLSTHLMENWEIRGRGNVGGGMKREGGEFCLSPRLLFLFFTFYFFFFFSLCIFFVYFFFDFLLSLSLRYYYVYGLKVYHLNDFDDDGG